MIVDQTTSFLNHRDRVTMVQKITRVWSYVLIIRLTMRRFDYLHLTYRSMVAVAGSPTSLFATQVYRPASVGLSAWNRRRDLSYKNGISPSCQWEKNFILFLMFTGNHSVEGAHVSRIFAARGDMKFTLFLQDMMGTGTPFATQAMSTSSPKFTSSLPDSGIGWTLGGSASNSSLWQIRSKIRDCFLDFIYSQNLHHFRAFIFNPFVSLFPSWMRTLTERQLLIIIALLLYNKDFYFVNC